MSSQMESISCSSSDLTRFGMLRKVIESNLHAGRMIDWMSGLGPSVREISISSMQSALEVNRTKATSTLRLLVESNCAIFVSGYKGSESRVRLRFNVNDIVNAARGLHALPAVKMPIVNANAESRLTVPCGVSLDGVRLVTHG